MINVDPNNPITTMALEKWGPKEQINILLEECSEVILAIAHYKRKRCGITQVAEEMADVLICMKSVTKAFNIEHEIKQFMDFKLKRLEGRLK